MSHRLRQLLQFASLLVACATLSGCRDQPPARMPDNGPPRLMALSELTEAEKRFGHSASTAPGLTCQPDVGLLPAGAEAVRSAGSDGMSWTIDPGARGVEDIQPGKVLLLTSRAAGSVLDVSPFGEGASLPEPVKGAINSILRALNIRTQIESSGGLQTNPMILVNIGRKFPSVEACG